MQDSRLHQTRADTGCRKPCLHVGPTDRLFIHFERGHSPVACKCTSSLMRNCLFATISTTMNSSGTMLQLHPQALWGSRDTCTRTYVLLPLRTVGRSGKLCLTNLSTPEQVRSQLAEAWRGAVMHIFTFSHHDASSQIYFELQSLVRHACGLLLGEECTCNHAVRCSLTNSRSCGIKVLVRIGIERMRQAHHLTSEGVEDAVVTATLVCMLQYEPLGFQICIQRRRPKPEACAWILLCQFSHWGAEGHADCLFLWPGWVPIHHILWLWHAHCRGFELLLCYTVYSPTHIREFQRLQHLEEKVLLLLTK